MKKTRIGILVFVALLLAGCSSSPSAKTEVKPGTSSASGKSVEVRPTSTKKTRTVLRIKPPTSSQEKPR